MKKIKVSLKDRSYGIFIGRGALRELPRVIRRSGFRGPVVILTDPVVSSNTSRLVEPMLASLSRSHENLRITVPSSERSKSLAVYGDTVEKIARKTQGKKPLIVALGGGVVGDLAGFIAATFRRGVPFIQVPTTLLAQVDSSIGGKCGVDLLAAKNLIGAFYQPRAVIADVDILSSLPTRQVRNGMAEVVKYAVIKSPALFDMLEKDMPKVISLKGFHIEHVIYECAAIKARIVERDERDVQDVRIILNFGHTLGHAIETATSYSEAYNHGEAVALGMILAGDIALELGMISLSDLERIKNLIARAGLPTRITGVTPRKIMESMGFDKKFTSGANRLVLPCGIGSVKIIDDIPELLIKTVLRKYVRS
ncbi:MAG: 3-dehydroquinate synthase [Candidatus Omnitrophica bacterium]|jgi:3-dehydroquinate synthase|nr:3-dehydroquinate synthase [Candidatus Omnitrophota bacterium]MDD4012647.1 3-dehydroquinate synthase [Candidatus Omnitrophota bacterium]